MLSLEEERCGDDGGDEEEEEEEDLEKGFDGIVAVVPFILFCFVSVLGLKIDSGDGIASGE